MQDQGVPTHRGLSWEKLRVAGGVWVLGNEDWKGRGLWLKAGEEDQRSRQDLVGQGIEWARRLSPNLPPGRFAKTCNRTMKDLGLVAEPDRMGAFYLLLVGFSGYFLCS